MFELGNAILQWRRSFQQNCSLNDDRIDELESHLRESISELNRKGLSEEESFVVAMKRLGYAHTLDAEYQKNNLLGVSQERLAWMLLGYLGVTICGILSSAIISSLSTGMAYAGAGATATGVVVTLVQILFWTAVLLLLLRARASQVFGRYPRLSLTAMLFAMIALPFVKPLAGAAQARVVDLKWLQETHYWTGIGQFSIQLIIYAFCFVAVLPLYRSKGKLAVSQPV
ncbi:MAG: hypothetical protein IT423_21725 [Pirellulaceae bacterium]|nr:hypothetical protein [Pirellulaceae bacterium]